MVAFSDRKTSSRFIGRVVITVSLFSIIFSPTVPGIMMSILFPISPSDPMLAIAFFRMNFLVASSISISTRTVESLMMLILSTTPTLMPENRTLFPG